MSNSDYNVYKKYAYSFACFVLACFLANLLALFSAVFVWMTYFLLSSHYSVVQYVLFI